MRLVFYVTGHGFGHATRTLAVIEQLLAERPHLDIVVRSRVPAWFLRRSGPRGVEIQPLDTDTGMVQIDSLAIDEAGTARAAAEFYRTFGDRVQAEAEFLRQHRAAVVVGDIPPLAFAAADAARLPSVAISNFTWDWIYSAYPRFDGDAPGVIALIRDAYAKATLTLRLPFAGGFESMQATTRDIPLVARRSRLGRARTREALALPSDRPIVLGSFGGHTTALPYEAIAERCRIALVVTDYETPETSPSLFRYTADDLAVRGVRYEDLVAAADVVVSKPGYGIVSECIANDAALLYTSRGRFAENDVMVDAMSRVLRCRFIDQAALRAGHWQEAIDALMSAAAPAEHMRVDGAGVAAGEILRLADAYAPSREP